MRKFVSVFFLVMVLSSFGQNQEALLKGEKKAYEAKKNFKSKRSGQSYDIVYHHLKLNVDPGVRNIYGSVVSHLKTLEENFTQFSFDLNYRMNVDSVLFEGQKVNFNHVNDDLQITISSQNKDAIVVVEVFYNGDPSRHPERGFSYDFQHAGPVAWTLSQPYGALGWWPCKQQLVDKIDSVDLSITVPKNNIAASLGVLTQVDTLADSSRIYHWKHRYPVATYLVALAVSNYYEESHYIHLSDGDSIFHVDYMYPSYKIAADTLRWNISPMMRAFDSLFGEYPYRKEKHGHVMMGRGGGMEHQTMSFMGNLNFDLMAHELGHQWFGDKITCASWQDLWLNEGWATYTNAIAREFVQGKEPFLEFLRDTKSNALQEASGSVFAYDTAKSGELFNGNLRYAKGCMVLHQLRWEVGDSAFFAGTRNYMADADLCFGFAHTIDFQEAIEAASGQDLTGFFDRYIYKEGFPILTTRWNRISRDKIRLKLNQTTTDPSVPFFPLKVEYLAKGDGVAAYVEVDHTMAEEEIDLDVGFEVTELIYDPNEWLLARGALYEGNHSDIASISAYPNPSNGTLTVYLQDKKIDALEILDTHGRILQKVKVQELKSVATDISLEGLVNGVYMVRVYSGGETLVMKFVKSEN